MSIAVSSYAGWPALCDLGDPGWGDPRFPHVLCCFLLTWAWLVDVLVCRRCFVVFHSAMPTPEATHVFFL